MDIAKVMHEERVRLNNSLDDLNKQRTVIDEQITKVKQEIKAIDAYEAATGKAKPIRTRTRNTGVREQILTVLAAAPSGLKRADLLTQLNGSGKEQSISNALANLKKAGQITANKGLYSAISGT